MRHLFQKYYLEICALKRSESGGLPEVTDTYYLDKKGRLTKESNQRLHAKKFGYFKGVAMVKKVRKLYDESKWSVALVPVHEADFINYVQKGE
jgi:hypothetical protein